MISKLLKFAMKPVQSDMRLDFSPQNGVTRVTARSEKGLELEFRPGDGATIAGAATPAEADALRRDVTDRLRKLADTDIPQSAREKVVQAMHEMQHVPISVGSGLRGTAPMSERDPKNEERPWASSSIGF